MIVVARAKGGCSLNGREYLLNDCGDLKKFQSVSVAKAYLRREGALDEEEFDELEFIEESTR